MIYLIEKFREVSNYIPFAAFHDPLRSLYHLLLIATGARTVAVERKDRIEYWLQRYLERCVNHTIVSPVAGRLLLGIALSSERMLAK